MRFQPKKGEPSTRCTGSVAPVAPVILGLHCTIDYIKPALGELGTE